MRGLAQPVEHGVSAWVGAAMEGCHLSTGSWPATRVDRIPVRPSMTSSRFRHVTTGAGVNESRRGQAS